MMSLKQQELKFGPNNTPVRTNTGSGSITGSDPILTIIFLFFLFFLSSCYF